MKGISNAFETLKEKGMPIILICIILPIIFLICFAISIGFWTLVAALPIWIGSLIFSYTFKWIYALFAGVILAVFKMFLPSKEE